MTLECGLEPRYFRCDAGDVQTLVPYLM
jgi:hypothetical protein